MYKTGIFRLFYHPLGLSAHEWNAQRKKAKSVLSVCHCKKFRALQPPAKLKSGWGSEDVPATQKSVFFANREEIANCVCVCAQEHPYKPPIDDNCLCLWAKPDTECFIHQEEGHKEAWRKTKKEFLFLAQSIKCQVSPPVCCWLSKLNICQTSHWWTQRAQDQFHRIREDIFWETPANWRRHFDLLKITNAASTDR